MHIQAHRKDRAGQGVATFTLPPAGRQWLDVSAHVVERYLATYRAPATKLLQLIPAPLSLDVYRGHGFVSVCALELEEMGVAGTPSWLRFRNLEFLYRVGVRFQGAPSFLTLRSDVSARALAWLGRRFSHYRPRLADFQLAREDGFRLACRSREGGDGLLHVDPAGGGAEGSVFDDVDGAVSFLLGMRTSVDRRPDGRVQIQEIEHDPWGARFVRVREQRFAFLARLERAIGARLVLDHALGMWDLRQTWRAAR